ncbi:MAG: ComEC/Rec2 family competence protein [Thermanaerothrix sp.]|nr:ComEC/Rec2 family competence protein [Thermanaerothrix sp.]
MPMFISALLGAILGRSAMLSSLAVLASFAAGTGWLLICLGAEGFPRGSKAVAFWCVILSLVGAVRCQQAVSYSLEPRRIFSHGVVLLERSWGSRQMGIVSSSLGPLVVSPTIPIEEGQWVELEGEVGPFDRVSGRSSSGSFDQEAYWRSKGAVGVFEGELRPAGPAPGILGRFLRLKLALERRVMLGLPPISRGYILASWFGIKDPELVEAHRRWGTSHILAVSGFHVALLLGGIWLVLKPRRAGLLVGSLVLWGYVLMAGCPPSAVRAACMAQLGILSAIAGRGVRGMNLLFLGAWLMLLFNPWMAFDVGFRLSVVSVSVLLGVGGSLRGPWYPMLSLVVWLATYPLAASVFGSVPVVGILSNLAALPFLSVYLAVIFVLGIPSMLLNLGNVLMVPAEFAGSLFASIMDWLCDLMPRWVPYEPVLVSVSVTVLSLSVLWGCGFRGVQLITGFLGWVLLWSLCFFSVGFGF